MPTTSGKPSLDKIKWLLKMNIFLKIGTTIPVCLSKAISPDLHAALKRFTWLTTTFPTLSNAFDISGRILSTALQGHRNLSLRTPGDSNTRGFCHSCMHHILSRGQHGHGLAQQNLSQVPGLCQNFSEAKHVTFEFETFHKPSTLLVSLLYHL